MKNIYRTAHIIKIENETPKIKNFILDAEISGEPGQYIMVWLPRLNEKPFAVVHPSPLTVSVSKVGPFTEKLNQLRKGDKISFRGPYGSSFTLKGKKIMLIGGGYGVAPLYFLASLVPKIRRRLVTIIIGARSKDDLPFLSKFMELDYHIHVCTDDSSHGFSGLTTQLTERLLEKELFDSVYTCGPEPMMKKIAEICYSKKIFCQVSMERMFKCGGIGLCGECNFKGELVCKDGPVFNGKILSK